MHQDNLSKQKSTDITFKLRKKSKENLWNKISHPKVLIPIIVVFVVILIVIIVAIVLNRNSQGNNSESDSSTNSEEYSIEINPETGERPLFGSDPNKDNSGKAYVEFEQRIINSPETTEVDRNNSKIALAVYYNAINDYDESLKMLESINIDSIYGEQLVQYYTAYAELYAGTGDIDKEAEYRGLVREEEAKLQAEETEQ